MENLSMFKEYALNIPETSCREISDTGSSSALMFPPLLILIFIVMSYKYNKIYNDKVNIWKIITQHSVLHIFESSASIITLPLVKYYAKTCKFSIFFTEQIWGLSTWNLSSIFDLRIYVFLTLLLAPFSHFLIIILQILTLPFSIYLPLRS